MLQRARLGMLMFLLSETVFFFMLIASFVYFREASLSTAAQNLSLGLAAPCTVCLLASSFTIWRAVTTGIRSWLVATIALGLVFLAGQVTEYSRLLNQKITISQGLFGATFFTITGLHGLHVLAGLILLGLVLLMWRQSSWSAALHVVALYWYFIGLVWIAIFAVVYLWTLL